MSDDPQLRRRKIILYGYLEKCKIPLTKDDWAGFVKELDRLKVRDLFFDDWIKRGKGQFARRTKSGLFQDRINESLILALHQLDVLRPKAEVYDKEIINWWIHENLHDESRREKWLQQQAKKKRDRNRMPRIHDSRTRARA